MDPIIADLKTKLVDLLNLPDVQPGDIDPDEALVGGRLGIDSIDVLELVMMLEKDYGITIDSKELGAKVFATVRSMACYIVDQTKAEPS
ncbi:MAG: phosphopantetheine-binding protein [Desulfobacterales bacterium]